MGRQPKPYWYQQLDVTKQSEARQNDMLGAPQWVQQNRWSSSCSCWSTARDKSTGQWVQIQEGTLNGKLWVWHVGGYTMGKLGKMDEDWMPLRLTVMAPHHWDIPCGCDTIKDCCCHPLQARMPQQNFWVLYPERTATKCTSSRLQRMERTMDQ